MAQLRDLDPEVRVFMRIYPWRRLDPVPWSPLSKPLSECRVAMVSTAAMIMPGQEPFDTEARGGDCSFRRIPAEADPRALIDTHPSDHFDHSGLAADPNVAFPLERLRESAGRGRIGEVAPFHLSFMGALTATGRLVKQSAPAAAAALKDAGVDVVLGFPV